MAHELGFIERDVLDRHSPLTGYVLDHPIHQRKRVAMGQQPLDLLAAENDSAGGCRSGCRD
jgi:hypothetical protein